MLYIFTCFAAIVFARVCLIGGRPNQHPNQICCELGCSSVMATARNLPYLLGILKQARIEAAAVNGWNGVRADLVLRSNGALAPYDPKTNYANAAFCNVGYQKPPEISLPAPCVQPLQLPQPQPTTYFKPTHHPLTVDLTSTCHKPQQQYRPNYRDRQEWTYNVESPSYHDNVPLIRNTHREYSDVGENSYHTESSNESNTDLYNPRSRSRCSSNYGSWPLITPTHLPVNITATSSCGSVRSRQWPQHCYPKEHHQRLPYPLVRYNYNFNYYYRIHPHGVRKHSGFNSSSWCCSQKRHRRRKCPLIRKLEHCIKCKPHERCFGEAAFCDPCQRKRADLKICKENEEKSDERSSSHCHSREDRDSCDKKEFEREGSVV